MRTTVPPPAFFLRPLPGLLLAGCRTDLRHLAVCSVDPPGCKDIDDALHVRALPNGNYEIGVRRGDGEGGDCVSVLIDWEDGGNLLEPCVCCHCMLLLAAGNELTERCIFPPLTLPPRPHPTPCAAALHPPPHHPGVHIADVTNFVHPGTAMDEEAAAR